MEMTQEMNGDGSETFDSLRERIRDRFEDLSPHLQRIARMALDQPNQLALRTIAVIARDLGVQPSTLIRFAKEFGSPDSSSFINGLLDRIARDKRLGEVKER